MEPSFYQITQFVKRPATGNVGNKIKVRSNYFELFSLPSSDIIQYDVTITPNVPKKLNRKIFNRFVEQFLEGVKPVFDGT